MAERMLEIICLEEDTPSTRDVGDVLRWTVAKISRSKLQKKLKSAIGDFSMALSKIDMAKSSYQVNSIELSVAINTKGAVRILGSGIESGFTGGIKVTLKRADNAT